MSVKIILEFEDATREEIGGHLADLIAAEAENITGHAPWWRVEDSDDS
jgi:hypothetical protein